MSSSIQFHDLDENDPVELEGLLTPKTKLFEETPTPIDPPTPTSSISERMRDIATQQGHSAIALRDLDEATKERDDLRNKLLAVESELVNIGKLTPEPIELKPLSPRPQKPPKNAH